MCYNLYGDGMEDILKLIVNNGLGVASFGLLVYLVIKYMDKIVANLLKITNCLDAITKTQEELKTQMIELNIRVEKLENKGVKK